ncbi:MAG: type I-U CRISPR-associated protein Cas5/Cas6, partial [Rhodospirillales bacterium]
MPALLLSVCFHDGRYHGLPDWPPSPARLFQALVAGAARGAALEPADAEALEWLGKRGAPIIAAPHARRGESFTNFVPNNDLDAVGGDPKRVSEIRAGKTIRPMLFDAGAPLLYVWRFDRSDEMLAKRICAIAERLYQLGRGVDMAWATGEIVGDDKAVDDRFAVYNGVVCRPSGGGEGRTFAVPLNGSLQSLIARFEGGRARFERTRSNRSEQTLFKQPPKARFRQVAYNSPPRRLLFELHDTALE